MKDQTGPIRVLVVDDSPTIRRLVAIELDQHADIDCIGGAADPYEARDRIKAVQPDVLVLDVEMPRMNGLDFLRKVMKLRPMPVVMFSSLTTKGSRDAVEALSIGAIDCLAKSSDMHHDGTLAALPDMIRMAAKSNVAMSPKPARPAKRLTSTPSDKIILIGSSTGGVDALEQVLEHFPTNCPPTLITQHMPAEFLKSFAARLDQNFDPVIKVAQDGEPIEQGHVYIAPGGDYHLTLAPGSTPRCVLDPRGKVSGHRPSVDVMFGSAVPLASRIVAGILTGMGSDGANGMLDLRKAGARTLAQDEATSTVFGMPRVALEVGGAERAVPLPRIAGALLELCDQSRRLSA